MDRRTFLTTLAAAPAAAAPERYDIVIRNGELRDPARNLRRKADLGISGGVIAAIEDSIPAERAWDAIDAQGLYVTPGLIDFHTHCYWGGTGLGIYADPVAARSGTSTWVDAGSFAHDEVEGFRKFIVEPAQIRIYGYVYFYPANRNPDADPIRYARQQMRATARAVEANRDILLGVKVQVGSNMSGKYSPELFRVARELCDQYKLPLMTHISFSPPETQEVMDLMRPGDIVTHCYNAHTLGILDKAGKLKPGVREARERGVWFDIGHGAGSFNFGIARQAMDAGFLADTISTDIYTVNVNGPVFDLPTTMSKMMLLGMTFDEVLVRVTANPARIIDRVPKLGSLEVGAPADIALLEIEKGSFTLVDSQKNTLTAKQRVVSRLTIARGRRVRVPA